MEINNVSVPRPRRTDDTRSPANAEISNVVSSYLEPTQVRIRRQVERFAYLLHDEIQREALARGGFSADETVSPQDVDNAFRRLICTETRRSHLVGLGSTLFVGAIGAALTIAVVSRADQQAWFPYALTACFVVFLVGASMLASAWRHRAAAR